MAKVVCPHGMVEYLMSENRHLSNELEVLCEDLRKKDEVVTALGTAFNYAVKKMENLRREHNDVMFQLLDEQIENGVLKSQFADLESQFADLERQNAELESQFADLERQNAAAGRPTRHASI